jgi:hypothetical protein
MTPTAWMLYCPEEDVTMVALDKESLNVNLHANDVLTPLYTAPSWAFVIAAIIKENDRAWHAAQMFPQIMEEARVTWSGMVEALSAMRWAAKRGMPLPTEEEIAAQAALIEADKVRG